MKSKGTAQVSDVALTPEQTSGWTAYLDWADRLAHPDGEPADACTSRIRARGVAGPSVANDPVLWEPVFVRARDAAMEPDTFFDAARRAEGYSFDAFDLEYNVALRKAGEPVEAFLFRRIGTRPRATGFEALFDVLTVGLPVTRNGDTRPAPGLRQEPRNPDIAIGIIDDGIAVLHPRFRTAAGHTRFRAVWFQTLAGSDEILFAGDIDADLASLATRSEEAIYAARAARLYPAGTHHAMTRAGSHGTLMLDLAAGADPQSDRGMATIPIYAVQLPPQAFDDTSGRMLHPYVVQGIRWLIYHSLVLDRCRRLVVNLSLGIVAGPKDGTSFVERQLRREMDRVNVLGDGRQVDLVLAYGNAREERLIARKKLRPGKRLHLGVIVQPDDLTPSYAEIRLTPDSPVSNLGLLKVHLTAPDGRRFGGAFPPGTHVILPGPGGRPAAGLYHRAAKPLGAGLVRRAVKTAVFAPTSRAFDGDPICPSGRWILTLQNNSEAAMDVVVQVQSDDSPYPRRTGARQARLDHELAHEWCPDERSFTHLGDDGPLTYMGTNSAWGTVPAPNVHTISGALINTRGISAAFYSSQGADWSGRGPHASAVCETARVPGGLLGAGTFAAGTLRLSGTSAAAATFSRHLLVSLPDVPAPPLASRFGARTITDNPAIRRRP